MLFSFVPVDRSYLHLLSQIRPDRAGASHAALRGLTQRERALSTFLLAYDRAMDRTEWVSRFMRRMAQLDVRLRPGQIAEMASVMFEKYQASSPEGAADEAGKDGVRRDD